uniref:Uncharacterized protein n=1 Tax=Trichobilharzia regenti TaxID=157069 RepID=A0AA85JZN5_TRIRE|nr:unnamed protein product [Trichobilharzia regenti]
MPVTRNMSGKLENAEEYLRVNLSSPVCFTSESCLFIFVYSLLGIRGPFEPTRGSTLTQHCCFYLLTAQWLCI